MLTPPPRRRDPDPDRGFSLVELAVAMAVTSLLLAAVGAALVAVIGAYGRVQDTSLAADRGRVLLDRFVPADQDIHTSYFAVFGMSGWNVMVFSPRPALPSWTYPLWT